MLAAGLIDLIIETEIKPYDIVAVIPIVAGAGGIVTTWENGPAQNGGRIVVAGDSACTRRRWKMLANALKKTAASRAQKHQTQPRTVRDIGPAPAGSHAFAPAIIRWGAPRSSFLAEARWPAWRPLRRGRRRPSKSADES